MRNDMESPSGEGLRIGTAQEVRQLDSLVISQYGVQQCVLMDNAAVAARQVIDECWKVRASKVLIVCGTGNNGGDGFALARHLHARGAYLTVLLIGDALRFSEGAKLHYETAQKLPIKILTIDNTDAYSPLSQFDFSPFDLIVDALLGTGLSRVLDGHMASLVKKINRCDTPVLSLDIPSGINADTGEVLGSAIEADVTVSFGILKRGNLLYPGYTFGGKLYYSDISFPPEVINDDSLTLLENTPPLLPERNPAGYKGSFGKICVIGGSSQYRGAPALVASAALRAGAGYIRVAVPSEIAAQVFSFVPEAIILSMNSSEGFLGSEHCRELLEYASQSDITVLGPGLSTCPDSIRLARKLIPEVESPLVLDGDALTAVAGRDELCKNRKYPTILSPHSGEMARLLGVSVREVELNRISIALEAAKKYQSIVILKGAHSIIAAPSGESWMNLTGNSGMGTAGSGDVLSGLVAALLVTGSTPLHGTRLGVYLHGLAGDIVAKEKGETGLMAHDIVEHIPEAMCIFSEHTDQNSHAGKIIRL